MAVTVVPHVVLSANGASAFVDTAGRVARVFELPGGSVRWALGDVDELDFGSLSASGNALAWVGENDELMVKTDRGKTAGRLPSSRDRLRAVAPSDTGDRAACLVAGGGESRLVIAASGTSDAISTVEIPVFDSGFILVNDDCSLLVVGTSEHVGERHFTGAFVRDGNELRALWTERTAPSAHGAIALYGEWVFAATDGEITGWRRNGERVSLPGSMRERMIFSRDGRHLLVYRVDEVIEVTSARTLFRLIALPSLDEVRRTNHVIEDRQGAQFVLGDDLDVHEVRVTRAGELDVERLGWEG
jgi:hypothetical protein